MPMTWVIKHCILTPCWNNCNRLPPLLDIIFTQCLHFAVSLLFSPTFQCKGSCASQIKQIHWCMWNHSRSKLHFQESKTTFFKKFPCNYKFKTCKLSIYCKCGDQVGCLSVANAKCVLALSLPLASHPLFLPPLRVFTLFLSTLSPFTCSGSPSLLSSQRNHHGSCFSESLITE